MRSSCGFGSGNPTSSPPRPRANHRRSATRGRVDANAYEIAVRWRACLATENLRAMLQVQADFGRHVGEADAVCELRAHKVCSRRNRAGECVSAFTREEPLPASSPRGRAPSRTRSCYRHGMTLLSLGTSVVVGILDRIESPDADPGGGCTLCCRREPILNGSADVRKRDASREHKHVERSSVG